MCAKNYENWLAVDKVIAEISRLTFLDHPVYTNSERIAND